MPVYYDNQNIIPGPFVTIDKETNRAEDGRLTKITYVITLKGSLCAYKGSPNSSGTFWNASGYPPDEVLDAPSRLRSIITKQGALTKIFCNDNRLLEVQPFDGSPPLKAVVRLRSMNFEEGVWFEYCKYTITLEAQKIYFGNIESCAYRTTIPEESWSIEQDEKGLSYKLTHTLSAACLNDLDINGTIIKPGWQIAKELIHQTTPKRFLGLDSSVYGTPNALPLAGTAGYNYVRGESIDEPGGKYSVTESWILYDKALSGGVPCLQEFNISHRTDSAGKAQVTIEGTLTGLLESDNLTYDVLKPKIENAIAYWNILEPELATICNANSPVTLNPNPLTKVVGTNPFTGVLTFSREYDNRPILGFGIISYSLQIVNKNPNDIFASLVVLGKPQGPVLQDIHTVTARERRVSLELVYPASTMDRPNAQPPSIDDTDAVINAYKPSASIIFKAQDEDSWSPDTGRYSRNISWTYTL